MTRARVISTTWRRLLALLVLQLLVFGVQSFRHCQEPLVDFISDQETTTYCSNAFLKGEDMKDTYPSELTGAELASAAAASAVVLYSRVTQLSSRNVTWSDCVESPDKDGTCSYDPGCELTAKKHFLHLDSRCLLAGPARNSHDDNDEAECYTIAKEVTYQSECPFQNIVPEESYVVLADVGSSGAMGDTSCDVINELRITYVILATKSLLDEVMKVCGLQSPAPPTGQPGDRPQENQCPAVQVNATTCVNGVASTTQHYLMTVFIVPVLNFLLTGGANL